MDNITYFVNKEPIWFTAISNNNFSLWNFWLKSNPDITIIDSTGQTPLHWACFLKRQEMVLDLLKLGANPWKLDYEGYCPLFLAMIHPVSKFWSIEGWLHLFENNFNINKEEHFYYHLSNFIFKLSKNKKYEELEILFKLIPQYDIKSFITLKDYKIISIPWIQLAYIYKDIKLAKMFLHWGVDANSTDEEGYSSLEMAIVDENMEWVDFLLSNGAVFNTSKECDNYTLSCLTNGSNAYNIYSILENKNLDKDKLYNSFNKIENKDNKINFLIKRYL